MISLVGFRPDSRIDQVDQQMTTATRSKESCAGDSLLNNNNNIKEHKDIKASLQRRPKPSTDEIQELRRLYAERWMSSQQLNELEAETGKRFKRGKFSETEKVVIRRALAQYLQERDMTHQEFIDVFFTRKRQSHEAYDDERFKTLFFHVSKHLDGRPVLMVYQAMRRMFHPGNRRGVWSETEDAELQRLYLLYGPDWETIGLELGRYGMSCRDRFKLFRGRSRTGPWSPEEETRLRESMATLRNQHDGRPCWILVSEMVGTRSAAQCILKWASIEIVTKNDGVRPRWTLNYDHLLVTRIYELGIEHETEIRWNELADDSWPVYFSGDMLRNRFRVLKKRVRNERFLHMDLLLETLILMLRPSDAVKE